MPQTDHKRFWVDQASDQFEKEKTPCSFRQCHIKWLQSSSSKYILLGQLGEVGTRRKKRSGCFRRLSITSTMVFATACNENGLSINLAKIDVTLHLEKENKWLKRIWKISDERARGQPLRGNLRKVSKLIIAQLDRVVDKIWRVNSINIWKRWCLWSKDKPRDVSQFKSKPDRGSKRVLWIECIWEIKVVNYIISKLPKILKGTH